MPLGIRITTVYSVSMVDQKWLEGQGAAPLIPLIVYITQDFIDPYGLQGTESKMDNLKI